MIDAGDTPLDTQTTAGDGAYLLADLLPGDYIVDVKYPLNIVGQPFRPPRFGQHILLGK